MGRTLNEIYQSIINASNAKTGKADPSVTEAVRTLINGYGTGSGSGDIIDAAAPPNESSDTSMIYRVFDSYDIFVVDGEDRGYISDAIAAEGAILDCIAVDSADLLPEEGVPYVSDHTLTMTLYITKDTWDILLYTPDNGYTSLSVLVNCRGWIDDVTTAELGGLYVTRGKQFSLYCYRYGEWVKYARQVVRIEEVNGFPPLVVGTVAELPDDAINGTVAIVLGG